MARLAVKLGQKRLIVGQEARETPPFLGSFQPSCFQVYGQRVRVTFVDTKWHGRETGHSYTLVIHRFDAHPWANRGLTRGRNTL